MTVSSEEGEALHLVLKESGLGLTLGARKRLETELLRLRSTPAAAKARLLELGLAKDMRRRVEVALGLADVQEDDEERPKQLLIPQRGISDGFVRSKRLPSPRLRILCLHGFASNNMITKVQLEMGLGLESQHLVACDLCRSLVTTAARDASVDRLLDAGSERATLPPTPKPTPPTSTALTVLPDADKPPERKVRPFEGMSAWEQAEHQQKLAAQHRERLEREQQLRLEMEQYLGLVSSAPPQPPAAAPNAADPVYTWFEWPKMPSALPEQRESMQQALRRVMGAVAEHGPYDGIFGFSQGAVLATTLSSPQSWRDCFGLDYCPWKFVILANAAGTKALSSHGLIGSDAALPLALDCSRTPIGLPSFHLIGSLDTHNRGASLEAKALYDPKTAVCFTHPFGHELPSKLRTDEELKQSLSSFLSQFGRDAKAAAAHGQERATQSSEAQCELA
jgi:hypothetical protein